MHATSHSPVYNKLTCKIDGLCRSHGIVHLELNSFMGKANYFSKQLTLYDQETTDQYVCLDTQSGFSTASAVQYYSVARERVN